MATQPRTCAEIPPSAYRPHCLAKNERNQALIADYYGGMTRRELAEKYGLHIGRVGDLFHQWRVLLAPEERERRRLTPARPPGRPALWPDVPAHLAADYALLRRKGFRAREARAMLDPEFRA